jgi:hypothetical protein
MVRWPALPFPTTSEGGTVNSILKYEIAKTDDGTDIDFVALVPQTPQSP